MSQSADIRIGGYDVQIVKKLAEGGFGLVYLVADTRVGRDMNTQMYCLKKCAINRQESYDTVKKEVNLLNRFAGPNVVQLLASEVNIRSGTDALLLLEYCPGGHLLDRLLSRNGEHLPENTIFRIFGQILLAIKPMHESKPPVVHRDLKLENILFGKDNVVRVCDFGSCYDGYIMLRDAGERSAAEESISKETTQMYRAPEMIDIFMRPRLTEKTDIWALGCIFYALCFLTHPFQDAGSLGILGAKIKMPPNAPVSAESRVMITRMLDFDPEGRPSIQELLDCFSAIVSGNSLPAFEPSPEVLLRRKERAEAEQRRAEKNAKKAPASNTIHKKVPDMPLDSNSVAARRLAAKRGQPVGQPRAEQSSFADFSSVEMPINPAVHQSTSASQYAESLFFSGENSQAAFVESDSFSAFASHIHDDAFTTSSDVFNSFSAPSSSDPVASTGFDAFNTNISATSFDATVAFAASTGSGGFDAFSPSDNAFASAVHDGFSSEPFPPSSAFPSDDGFGSIAVNGGFGSGNDGFGGDRGVFGGNGFPVSEGFSEFGSLPTAESNRSSYGGDDAFASSAFSVTEATEKLSSLAPFDTFHVTNRASSGFSAFDDKVDAFNVSAAFDAFGSPASSPSRAADVFGSNFSSAFPTSPAPASSNFSPSPAISRPSEDILDVFNTKIAQKTPLKKSATPSVASNSAFKQSPEAPDLLGPIDLLSSDLLGNVASTTASSVPHTPTLISDLLNDNNFSCTSLLKPQRSKADEHLLSLFDQPSAPRDAFASLGGNVVPTISPQPFRIGNASMGHVPMGMQNAPVLPPMLSSLVANVQAQGMQGPPRNPFAMGGGPHPVMGAMAGMNSPMMGGAMMGGAMSGSTPVQPNSGKLMPTRGLQYESVGPGKSRDAFSDLSSFPK